MHEILGEATNIIIGPAPSMKDILINKLVLEVERVLPYNFVGMN